MFGSIKRWWRGVPPQVTETESGGWRIIYQNPDHPPARHRLKAAIGRLNATMMIPIVAWMLGLVALVIAAAIVKWFGLASAGFVRFFRCRFALFGFGDGRATCFSGSAERILDRDPVKRELASVSFARMRLRSFGFCAYRGLRSRHWMTRK
jgi:hypothetical protein